MTKKNIVRRIADDLDRTELETKLIVQKTPTAVFASACVSLGHSWRIVHFVV